MAFPPSRLHPLLLPHFAADRLDLAPLAAQIAKTFARRASTYEINFLIGGVFLFYFVGLDRFGFYQTRVAEIFAAYEGFALVDKRVGVGMEAAVALLLCRVLLSDLGYFSESKTVL